MSEHISDLRIDQLIAGDLSASEADALRSHADACEPCAARIAELTGGARAFVMPFPRKSRAGWIAAGAAIAIAATAVLVIRRDPEPDTRTKGGGPKLVLVLGSHTLEQGDRIAPGDRLQAIYTTTRDGFGAVLSRDGKGTLSTYVPSRGGAMVALPAGTSASFPESTILDDVVGDETIVMVWCDAPHDTAPLLANLGTAPTGCVVERIVLNKR